MDIQWGQNQPSECCGSRGQHPCGVSRWQAMHNHPACWIADVGAIRVRNRGTADKTTKHLEPKKTHFLFSENLVNRPVQIYHMNIGFPT